MIIIARPHAITSATAMAWPFMRRKSRHNFLSRCEIKGTAPGLELEKGECCMTNDGRNPNSEARIPKEIRIVIDARFGNAEGNGIAVVRDEKPLSTQALSSHFVFRNS